MAAQYVDPEVSRAKFEREISDFRSLAADYRVRGWFLVKAEWPVAVVVLVSSRTKPPTVVAAVQFNYANYDAEPPSVRFVDPFSGQPLQSKELPTRLPRMILGPGGNHARWQQNAICRDARSDAGSLSRR